ncbi:MAG: choice-of-anchor L domain-containing protein [Taibaiella sp.]|jgi:gliding motility-associated-like protein
MNKYLHYLGRVLSILLLSFYSFLSFGQLTVTANQTAFILAQKLAGTGITIANANLTCSGTANGIFTVQASNLGLDSGIVLTTGHAASVAGSESGLTSYNNNTTGDVALQTLSGAATTRDACILEFDLVPKGDTLKFDYVFGSEEYINSVCGPYNDAFAFFISGPGITGIQNMAQVPGTTIPVAVNSINNGVPGMYGALPNCTSMGAGSPFTTYYNNNTSGTTVAYRGLTTVLTAAHAVNPCDTYHLKLTIADAVNGLYDSGVFIKAGSLQSSTFSITATGPVTYNGGPAIYKGCSPGNITFSRSLPKPSPQVLTFQIVGTAVNGIDYTTLPTTVTIPANASDFVLPVNGLVTPPSGFKTLKILLNAPLSCTGITDIIDSAELYIIDEPAISMITEDTTICEGTFLNIEANGSTGLTYSWSPGNGLSNTAAVNPVANPAISTLYTLKAFAAGSGCDTLSEAISITVMPKPLSLDAGDDIDICEHTPIFITPLITPDDNSFTYLWNMPQANTSTEKELQITDPVVAQSGIYYFTVKGGVCGTLMDSVYINIVEFPALPQVESPLKVCLNEDITTLPAKGKNLKWYKEASGGQALDGLPIINIAIEGTHDFYVSQSYGICESERVKLTVIVERCCDDFIFIPSAFTPNQDGMNDYFEMSVNNGSRIERIEVYNRWGQMVYQRDNGSAWNGMYQGRVVDLGNYFYNVTYTCKDGTVIHKKGEVLVVK